MLERSRPRAALSCPPSPHTEWAVLHSTASIIHQAAEKTIHIHKFSQRELWSRWYKRLYGSDHISHSGLINSWMASQRLLAALHMFQLPQNGKRKNNNNIKYSNNKCVCTCYCCLWLDYRKKKSKITAIISTEILMKTTTLILLMILLLL